MQTFFNSLLIVLATLAGGYGLLWIVRFGVRLELERLAKLALEAEENEKPKT